MRRDADPSAAHRSLERDPWLRPDSRDLRSERVAASLGTAGQPRRIHEETSISRIPLQTRHDWLPDRPTFSIWSGRGSQALDTSSITSFIVQRSCMNLVRVCLGRVLRRWDREIPRLADCRCLDRGGHYLWVTKCSTVTVVEAIGCQPEPSSPPCRPGVCRADRRARTGRASLDSPR